MNYFEAYRIVQAYCKALSMPREEHDILYPLSRLKNSKDEIWDAYKLFIAHILLYKSRTPEEFQTIRTQPTYLEMFYDDALANRVNYLSNYAKKKSIFVSQSKRQQADNELKRILPMDFPQKMLNASSKVDQIIEQIHPIHDELVSGIQKTEYMNRFLLSISRKVYETFNLPCNNDEDITFLPYNMYRSYIKGGIQELRDIYSPYLDIILDEKNR